MTAEIITVGNEILAGMVVNTNAAFIGERLTRIGCDVEKFRIFRWIGRKRAAASLSTAAAFTRR